MANNFVRKKEIDVKKIFIFLIIPLFCGCATAISVRKGMKTINYGDGISRKEALTIARMSVINSKMDGYYKIWLASINDRGEYYIVSIPSFALNEQECILIIEKKSGEILAFWQAKNNDEITRELTQSRSVEEWRKLKRFYP